MSATRHREYNFDASLASSAPLSVPQKWRRPVRQRSRLVRRTGPAHARVAFAHHSEHEFARFLDYYRIRWVYEPVSFPIAWEGERVAEMFTPDFYLPEHDLYIELTTMKQSLVTPKNRKVRLLRELYPDVNVRLLYRKDYQQLLAKAGYSAVEVQNLRKQDIGGIVISPVELETRVRALARKISRDYAGRSIVLVGVLKGITFFLADLARQIKVPFVIDYLDVRRFAGAQPRERVHIARDIDYPIAGRHVLLVEDIVNTGLTLDFLLSELRLRNPASVEVVTLLDRPTRRLVEVPVRYVGFQLPIDYVVGYGLDYRELYRNLPFICTLRASVYEIDALAAAKPQMAEPEKPSGAPILPAPSPLDPGTRLQRLLGWMARQDFATVSAGEPGLLRQVEEIVIESHRRLYELQGRAWSKPIAYRWLRFEDPMPVARLLDGVKKLRRRAASFNPDAVEKACVDAVKDGFSY
jgi:hypoxanthine phosphoribosyltransferase